jgi:formylglycine-generating enzyme required for sulfatase activity
MGSPTNEVGRNPYGPTTEEGPQTEVTISHGFWMGKYEVTQGQYQAVTGTNPSGFKGDPNLPVDSVTWFNATNYCGKLTQQERAAGRIPNDSAYRLPTEGEWEYACRALTSTRFSYGDDPDYSGFSAYGWYDGNSGGTTHPVGLKLPNPWGLHDMHGNVGEWCQDWFGPHPGGIVLDPKGPATGTARVSKGGPWLRPPTSNRSAFRLAISPDAILDGAGFRVVLAAGQP